MSHDPFKYAYNPSYSCIRPFIEVITPFVTGRCLPCNLNHGFWHSHAELANHTFRRNVWSAVPSSATSFPANWSETPSKKSAVKPNYYS